MKVLKFGGTSVGTIESLRNVKRIVESLDSPAVVVVSALGGLTDRLIATARESAEGKDTRIEAMEGFAKRHHDIIHELVPQDKQGEVLEKVDAMLTELGNLYLGVSLINELPDRTLDRIVSFGERMSSVIVAAIISGACHKDSLQFVKTERWMDRNIADRKATEQLIQRNFPLPLERHCVIGGFISRDNNDGSITNLGRGGSDYTAALVAAALDADMLEIWTDVDGFMTSDPRIIKDAKVIPDMSFVESMELCSFGAKVIYPPTIYPVFHKNIPIKILNTHRPEVPGTLITDNATRLPDEVRGVSYVRDTATVTIHGKVVKDIEEVNTRTYNAMARNGISVMLATGDEDAMEFTISVKAADARKALETVRNEFAPEIGAGDVLSVYLTEHLAIIAVVKEGIRRMHGLGARLTSTLSRNGITVNGLSEGTSDSTLALVVNDDKAEQALKLVHDSVIPA